MLLCSIIIIIKNTRHLVHWSHCCKPGQENSTYNSLYNFFKLNVNPRDVWVVWMGCTSGSWCNWELGSKSVNQLFLTGDPGHLVRVSNWVCVVSISCLSFDATKKPVSVTWAVEVFGRDCHPCSQALQTLVWRCRFRFGSSCCGLSPVLLLRPLVGWSLH